MRYPFLAGAAVALATAVLAACGSSGGSGDGGGKAAAGGTPPAAASAAPSVAGPTASPSGSQAAKPSSTPKAPAGDVTPATGSFTKKQKEYLTDRVPKGMDPAAVLQTGQETCDRLRYLVKADRDIAVAAVVSDEVTDAGPAVAHLCPQHQDVIDEAALGYADGTHKGAALRPGRYRAPSPTKACSWQVAGAKGKELEAGSSGTGKQVEITIADSARTFTSTGCYAWLPQGDNG
ncbi:hypothetical protein [Streptomyces sp. CB02058]|uniref:hypothetical protein n=1 Tax=Streptomyces sp. CB02058 TaxID=1703921 RepID=UPI00093A59B8|nr:hypothetical protein [Streptomyces sp. CB02058]OKI93690.1 hypothetical protein AMK10_14880 [Streptomyces sp. CB02058]